MNPITTNDINDTLFEPDIVRDEIYKDDDDSSSSSSSRSDDDDDEDSSLCSSDESMGDYVLDASNTTTKKNNAITKEVWADHVDGLRMILEESDFDIMIACGTDDSDESEIEDGVVEDGDDDDDEEEEEIIVPIVDKDKKNQVVKKATATAAVAVVESEGYSSGESFACDTSGDDEDEDDDDEDADDSFISGWSDEDDDNDAGDDQQEEDQDHSFHDSVSSFTVPPFLTFSAASDKDAELQRQLQFQQQQKQRREQFRRQLGNSGSKKSRNGGSNDNNNASATWTSEDDSFDEELFSKSLKTTTSSVTNEEQHGQQRSESVTTRKRSIDDERMMELSPCGVMEFLSSDESHTAGELPCNCEDSRRRIHQNLSPVLLSRKQPPSSSTASTTSISSTTSDVVATSAAAAAILPLAPPPPPPLPTLHHQLQNINSPQELQKRRLLDGMKRREEYEIHRESLKHSLSEHFQSFSENEETTSNRTFSPRKCKSSLSSLPGRSKPIITKKKNEEKVNVQSTVVGKTKTAEHTFVVAKKKNKKVGKKQVMVKAAKKKKVAKVGTTGDKKSLKKFKNEEIVPDQEMKTEAVVKKSGKKKRARKSSISVPSEDGQSDRVSYPKSKKKKLSSTKKKKKRVSATTTSEPTEYMDVDPGLVPTSTTADAEKPSKSMKKTNKKRRASKRASGASANNATVKRSSKKSKKRQKTSSSTKKNKSKNTKKKDKGQEVTDKEGTKSKLSLFASDRKKSHKRTGSGGGLLHGLLQRTFSTSYRGESASEDEGGRARGVRGLIRRTLSDRPMSPRMKKKKQTQSSDRTRPVKGRGVINPTVKTPQKVKEPSQTDFDQEDKISLSEYSGGNDDPALPTSPLQITGDGSLRFMAMTPFKNLNISNDSLNVSAHSALGRLRRSHSDISLSRSFESSDFGEDNKANAEQGNPTAGSRAQVNIRTSFRQLLQKGFSTASLRGSNHERRTDDGRISSLREQDKEASKNRHSPRLVKKVGSIRGMFQGKSGNRDGDQSKGERVILPSIGSSQNDGESGQSQTQKRATDLPLDSSTKPLLARSMASDQVDDDVDSVCLNPKKIRRDRFFEMISSDPNQASFKMLKVGSSHATFTFNSDSASECSSDSDDDSLDPGLLQHLKMTADQNHDSNSGSFNRSFTKILSSKIKSWTSRNREATSSSNNNARFYKSVGSENPW